MPYYIVPLGCDYNEDRTAIGQQTIMRCEKALHIARKRRLDGVPTEIVCAPGIESSRKIDSKGSSATMAVMMQDWFCEQGENVAIVNMVDTDIPFDTLGEIDWALAAIKDWQRKLNRRDPNAKQFNDMSSVVVTFVSNRRHLWRVWCALKLFYRLPRSLFASPDGFVWDGSDQPIYTTPEVTFAESDDRVPSLWHECLGYGKLLLIKCGVIKHR